LLTRICDFLNSQSVKRRYALWQGKACYKAYFCNFTSCVIMNDVPSGESFLIFARCFGFEFKVTSRKNLRSPFEKIYCQIEREFRLRRIYLLAAHVSELPSPCSQYANPYSCRFAPRGGSPAASPPK